MLYLGLPAGERLLRVLLGTWTMTVAYCGFRQGKTRNAKRRLKIPEQVRPLVLARIEGQESDAPIFYPVSSQNPPQWILRRAACAALLVGRRTGGVSARPTRNARDTALEGGATSDAVAKALGHARFG